VPPQRQNIKRHQNDINNGNTVYMFKLQTAVIKLLKFASRVVNRIKLTNHGSQVGFILSTEVAFADWPEAAQHPELPDGMKIQHASQGMPDAVDGLTHRGTAQSDDQLQHR
jgi:hypothetical protein